MHVALADHGDLPLHRLVAALEPSDDRALPLRVMSLLHRRGVPVVELHLRSTGRRPGDVRPDQVVILFRSTERHAHVVRAGFDSMVFVTGACLELNVPSASDADAHVNTSECRPANARPDTFPAAVQHPR